MPQRRTTKPECRWTPPQWTILIIPGMGPRWRASSRSTGRTRAWAQFDEEIGKYVDAKEVKRLARVVIE
jgi:hypothetical protein